MTPAALEYRWPAEWERHEATWLAWPKNPTTWPGHLEEAARAWVEMAAALAEGERVEILVDDGSAKSGVRDRLARRGVGGPNIRLRIVPTDDAWMRDTGPIFVKRSREVALTCWRFNAWGGKYECARDAKVSEAVRRITGLPAFETGLVLEGGSIDGNGAGTLLTTEDCLLRPTRNPHLDRAGIERALRENLGVSRVVWLGVGIAGDDTDGHVDDVARFVDARTVVACVEEDPRDVNYKPLQENLDRLRRATDQDGRPLDVIPLPMPPAVVSDEGARLPASHANFYVGNAAVLVPAFGGPSDAKALEILRPFFPGRKMLGVDCRIVVMGLGAIHCVTQQQPAGN